MVTLDRATLVEGTRLRVSNGDRKHIDLLADGTLIAVAAFEGFLSWGPHDFQTDPKIHGLALVEFTYEFVALYSGLLEEYIEPRPHGVRFQLGIRSAVFADDHEHRRALYLRPGPIPDFPSPVPFEKHVAPASELTRETDVTVGDDGKLDVATVAYQLVRQFYNWFSHTDDAIPYTVEGRDEIDIGAIKALR
jgi:hypothetical protein